MLLQFRFKNFKSFRDDTILDLTATKITEYSDHVVSIGNEKVLPVAVIYGANASGKSNVYKAFKYMAKYVILSFGYEKNLFEEKDDKYTFKRPTPFLLDNNSVEAESLFEIYFIETDNMNTKTYNYGFTIGQNGIIEEWLNSKTKSAKKYNKVFYRNNNDKILDLDGISEVNQNISAALEKETLIVSLGAKLKIAQLKLIRDWFLENEFIDFGDSCTNCVLFTRLPDNFVTNINKQEHVVKYFSSFDSSIKGFDIEKLNDNEEKDGRSKYKINAFHNMIDSDEKARIPLPSESAGTLKMFALYPKLEYVLKNGGFLFIDELNSRLHPLLVRAFIITFLDKNINKNHAQLIFTTHDAWQLNSNIFRRDEVWFTEKDNNGLSTLYSLAEFEDKDGNKIRKDENYEKNYLLGKYGAIPVVKGFDMF